MADPAFVSTQHSADPNIGTGYTVTNPAGISNGDLLIAQCVAQESNVGASALLNTIAGYTDMFTDGYSEPGTAKQYVIDIGGSVPRFFWWIGYKAAASEPASFGITFKTAALGYSRSDFDVLCYNGIAPGPPVPTWATNIELTVDTELNCPSLTIAGTPTGPKVWDSAVAGNPRAPVSISFPAATAPEFLMVTGGWKINGGGFTPPAGVTERVDFNAADSPNFNIAFGDGLIALVTQHLLPIMHVGA